MEGGDSEVGEVGVSSGSQTVARVGVVTLHIGSSEDGGGSEEGGDQELSVEEHRMCVKMNGEVRVWRE